MSVRKVLWAIRFIFYKPLFKKCGNIGYLGKPTFITGFRNIIIGNKVRIFPGARLECYDNGKIIIEDDVSIGQNVHITCGKEDLIIKSGTVITGNVFITNINHLYDDINISILKQGYTANKTIIGNDCFIGFASGILPGTKIGNHCVVGAHSIVNRQVDDCSVVAGCPAKVIRKYDFNKKEWVRNEKQ